MAVVITPRYDPTGERTVRVDRDSGEVVVEDPGEALRYRVRDDRPARLGWVRIDRSGRSEAVSVAQVACECLRDLDGERAVVDATIAAAERVAACSPTWREAALRLREQAHSALRSRRVAVALFQKWWRHLAEEAPEAERLSKSLACERAGYRMPDGRHDTTRLLRRLGLSESEEGGTRRRRLSESVNYETGLALCRALGRDPVELGL